MLVSLLFATPLTFAMAPLYIGALALTALIIWQVTGDGKAAAFEGFALVALYIVLAVLTFVRVSSRAAPRPPRRSARATARLEPVDGQARVAAAGAGA